MNWKKSAILILLTLTIFWPKNISADSFNSSNLISDGVFTNIDAMSRAEIQSFLELKGGFLKSYSENGRSAAQIIYDAAHGYGDATGSINGISISPSTGTVNPQVILVTLQKEQSLVTMASSSDAALRTAMGYGCPDSGGCNAAYAGFTKQVENGAWQLRYNYERAQGRGFSDYQVSQNACFSDVNGTNCVTFDNKATASLYRYTPHVYNGNYNFWNFFNQWFVTLAYAASWAGQGGNSIIFPGESTNLTVSLKNIGSETWNKTGSFPVRLGTDRARDRGTGFLREDRATNQPSGWLSHNRIPLTQSSVAPGEIGTFSFWITAPSDMKPGTYREYFRSVADGYGWMNDLGIYWDIQVRPEIDRYQSSWAGQNDYPTLSQGQSYQFTVNLKNTGTTTWQKALVHLGTDRARDRGTGFLREGNGSSGWISQNRIEMLESSVAPGEIAHFNFWMKVPIGMATGTYREYFRPVADGIGWMNDMGIYWDITVR